MKGILIIAAGHHYYGKMAATLAATIKATGTAIPIHLAYSTSALTHLTDGELALFDSRAEIPAKYLEPAIIRVKLFINKLSPFEETLFLDADMVWLQRKPEEIFETLKEVDITFSNHGVAGYSIWADLPDVRAAYELGDKPFYLIHSEFIYFKKTVAVGKFFTLARKINDTLKVKSIVFAGGIPDELPFSIAACQLDIKPHQNVYHPVWWRRTWKVSVPAYKLYNDFYALSMGGNYNDSQSILNYDTLSRAAYRKLEVKGSAFTWKKKRNFLAERSLI
jgi:hypothetical protein